MSLKYVLFPPNSRFFPGQRWANICLRTLHLIGVAGLGGGFLYPAAGEDWRIYLDLVVWSGVGLVAIAIWNNGIWLLQLCGQAVILKLLLLALIPFYPDLRLPLLLAVIVISGVVSHAPAGVRHFSIIHGRRLESL